MAQNAVLTFTDTRPDLIVTYENALAEPSKHPESSATALPHTQSIIQPWSTEYARSLSVAQWVDEIEARFVLAIEQQINSLPFRGSLYKVIRTGQSFWRCPPRSRSSIA